MFLLPLLFVWVQLAAAVNKANDCGQRDSEVLILGAGITGISVAKTLSENGITDFLILEAEDGIGGRVKNTVLKSGVRVELGANWIQGIDPDHPDKHPLWSIAQKCGGLGGVFMETFNNETMHVFDQNGINITDSIAFKERFGKWNKTISPGLTEYSLKRQGSGLPDITAREALASNGWIPSTPMDDMIEWYGFDADEYAISPEHVSLYGNFPDDTYFDFGNPDNTLNYFVTDQEEGFVKVVRCLAKEFLSEDDSRLLLDTTVTEIDWSDNQCVCVSTSKNKKFCATDAIITFSLGVLQSNTVKFIPSIPTGKRSIIDKGQFCLYLKIFLEFEEIFWKEDLIVDSIIRIDPIRGRYIQFQPLNKFTPILFTTVTGEMAKMVYNQTVEETTNQIMKILRTIYGEAIHDPISVTIPDWWLNPFYKGMYTTYPVGFQEEEVKILAEPLGRLHFGGEATSYQYSGYVHGGYFSGIDVANEIMKRRKKDYYCESKSC